MEEVDGFLDRVQTQLQQSFDEKQVLIDEASTLRSQVDQLRLRLASAREEIDASRQIASKPTGQETIVVERDSAEGGVEVDNITALVGLEQLRAARETVRDMLMEQLGLVDRVRLPGDQGFRSDSSGSDVDAP